jgi:hypothetical protein
MSLLRASVDKKNNSEKKTPKEEPGKTPKKKATSRVRKKAS